MQSKFVFLTGSSAVGKSEIFDLFPSKISRAYSYTNGRGELTVTCDTLNVVKIKMPTREVRHQLGNPSWEDLLKYSELAQKHQDAIYDTFTNIISEVVANAKSENHLYLFERSDLDVQGYSYAYGLIDRPGGGKNTIAANLGVNYFCVYRPIDKSIAYEQIPERPTKYIREACNDYIDYEVEFMLPQVRKFVSHGSTGSAIHPIIETLFR